MPVGADYRYPVIPIERFRKIGLDPPIALSADTGRLRLTLVGCVALVIGGVFGLEMVDESDRLGIISAIVVFGLAALYSAFLLITFSRRAGLIFSKSGIYHGLFGVNLEWRDVGPAWIKSTRVRGREFREVLFLLRREAVYAQKMRWDMRLLFLLMSSDPKLHRCTGNNDDLSRLREMVIGERDSVAIPIAENLRLGLSNDETVEIINTVVLKHNQPSVEGA